ncbi:hypothetical protein JXB11_02390 [Candidatus Woesearchaeota archaeon]|nr:hypothetical protein [Candidatus Woesearchaeota archaeon]
MAPLGTHGKDGNWGDLGWCAVLQGEDGNYSVVPCFDRFDMHRPWPEDGTRLDKPHIIIKAAEGFSQQELCNGIEETVKSVMENIASHKGWSKPKPEAMLDSLKSLYFVQEAYLGEVR